MTTDNRPIIIGLTGQAGAGKDTIGEYLAVHRGFAQDSFAAPIRKALAAINLGAEAYDDKDKPIPGFGVSWRVLARSMGTDWGREMIGQSLWVDLLHRRVQTYLDAGIPLVVTDLRMENEAAYIRATGGQVWRVTRPGFVPRCDQDHPTESGVHGIAADVELVNNGTVEELYEQVDAELIRQGHFAGYNMLTQDDVAW